MSEIPTAAVLGEQYRHSAALSEALERVADQLDRWADQSQHGGWSTHQVKPMQELAAKIRRSLVVGRPGDI